MDARGGKILYVDLTTGKIRLRSTPEELVRDYLGGEGFAVKLFYDAMDPKLDAFDPKNVLVVAPGLFTGVAVPTAGKTAFVSKSPLTGTIAESIMGGGIGAELKAAGYDAVVIEGKCDSPSYLLIDDKRAELRSAAKHWGKFTRDTEKAIREEVGDFIVACIGPGGEKLVRFAGIDCEDRQSGRGGLGAVMGSKNLKAIAVRGTKDITVADPEKLAAIGLKWQAIMEKSNAFNEDTKYGSGEFLGWVNSERGVFPTRNWKESVFDSREKIDPYYWAPRYGIKNKGCFACTKACGKLFVIEKGQYAGTVLDGVEYETLYSLGSQCGNGDIEALARANEICDIYGIDTISTGVVIGFVMELVERGVLDPKDIGVDCRFTNPSAVPEMAEIIGERRGMGRLFGEGVLRISRNVKRGSEDYAIQVKGMEPPAYDVRGLKGLGLGFMTSTRGACHLRSGFYALDLTGKTWRISGVDRFSAEGKGEQVRLMEDFMMVYDCLGMCKFQRGFFALEGLIEFLGAVIGSSFTEDDLLLVGERVNNLKQLFNLDAGIRREDSYLPKRVITEPIKSGVSKGSLLTEEEMIRMLDDYYEARRWDIEGRPTQWKLSQLGLD